MADTKDRRNTAQVADPREIVFEPIDMGVGAADSAAFEDAGKLQGERNAAARAALLHEFGGVPLAQFVAGGERGRVFAVRIDGSEWVPGFELDQQGKPLPVIAEVLELLGALRSPWQLALWFTGANGWLHGMRPVDLLLTDPGRVVEAARHEAEERVF